MPKRKHDDEPKTLYDLPGDVIGNISSFLDRHSLYQVMLATRHFGKSESAINEMNYRKYLKLLNPPDINRIVIPMQRNINYSNRCKEAVSEIAETANRIYFYVSTDTFKPEIKNNVCLSVTDFSTLYFVPPKNVIDLLKSVQPELLASSLNKALQIAATQPGGKSEFLEQLGEYKGFPLLVFFIYLLDIRCVQLLINNGAKVNTGMFQDIYVLLLAGDENSKPSLWGKFLHETLYDLAVENYSVFKAQLLSIVKILATADLKSLLFLVEDLVILPLKFVSQKIYPANVELFKLTIDFKNLKFNQHLVSVFLEYIKDSEKQELDADEKSAEIIEQNRNILRELILYAKDKFVINDLISYTSNLPRLYRSLVDVDIIAELRNIGFEIDATETTSFGLK